MTTVPTPPRRARRSVAALVAAALAGTAVSALALVAPTPAGAAPGVDTGSAGQTLTVSDVDALDPNGATVTVTGTGFDAEAGFDVSTMGLYLSVCVDKGAGQATPCIGGIDQTGGTTGTRWITNNPIGDADVVPISATGSFSTTLRVASWDENTDCLDLAEEAWACKIVTRVDHRGSGNRSQDVRVPIDFAAGPRLLLTPAGGFDPDGDDITVKGSGYPTTSPGVYVLYGPEPQNTTDATPYQRTAFIPSVAMAGGAFQTTLEDVQAVYTGADEVDRDFRTGGGFVSTFRAHGVPDPAGDWSANLPVVFDRRSAEESFVTATLTDFLGDAPTDGEVADGVDHLEVRGTAGYLRDLSTSDQWLEALVDKLYQDTLGRAGDPGGVAYWVGQLRSGRRTVARVAAEFYASDEYFDGIGGGTVGTWVDDLYQKILLRDSDPSGRAYWIGQVAAQGRGRVALRLYQSDESARTRVRALYQALLGRSADAAGLAYWTPRVISRGDLALAVFLAASPEYATRAVTRFP
ncbi:MAG TPA: DUF4214 domain-containing protein [Acidimicrobiales bacterium]|nr:DUF4214 domain-containing protein [Acidimicrobiales bacterium]